MKFLGDMGVSPKTILWLKSKGYEAKHLAEEGLHQLDDPRILEKARRENYVLLTCDLDFGQLLSNNFNSKPSVIIFRLEFQTPENHIQKLELILASAAVALEEGCLISVSDKKVRVRRLPVLP
ncbi:MAG: DUF5615 family PIN-like protein [Flammeovirgaceae bacterium]